MAIRIVTRLLLLLVALAAATTLIVGGMAALASATADDATSWLNRDQVAEVKKAIETPAGDAAGTSPNPIRDAGNTTLPPTVVLVFAGLVLTAALPPVYRVHVYHRSYHRPDWL
jgi:hypothetical protein